MRREAVGIVAILVAASLSVGYLAGITSRSTSTSASTLTSQQTALSSTTVTASCAAPSPSTPSPFGLGPPQQVGPVAFTFVGTNSTCITVSPSSAPSSANLTFTLDAPNQTILNLAIFPNAERGQVTVPVGTNFTASVGSQTYPIPVASDPFDVSPLVAIPSGDTTFHIEVSVPNSYTAGTYTFQILVTAFQNSAQKAETYGTYFSVNLVAQ
jgi:hypothetical protein